MSALIMSSAVSATTGHLTDSNVRANLADCRSRLEYLMETETDRGNGATPRIMAAAYALRYWYGVAVERTCLSTAADAQVRNYRKAGRALCRMRIAATSIR